MTIARRRLLQSLAATGALGPSANAQPAGVSLDVLRHTAMLHGADLSDARLEVLRPVVENRLRQLRALRDFEFDDRVGLTPGILR